MIAKVILDTAADVAFDVLARVARSGIWIDSHVKACRSTLLCRRFGDMFEWLAERPNTFVYQAFDVCKLPVSRFTARWSVSVIARAAGVGGVRCLVTPVGGQRINGVCFASRAALTVASGNVQITLDADPIALAYQFADARIRNAEYRQRTASRLVATFKELGICRLGDLQPGRLLAYFERQERLGNMFASTANAYRTAVWKFARWLVIDRKVYQFARVLAELDAQGVNQTAVIRGQRRQTRKGGRHG